MAGEIEISKRLVLINSVSSLAARLINVGVLVWLNQYLLREISPEEYALYPVVMSVIIFVPLATSILTSGVARYCVEAKAQSDNERVTAIVSTIMPLLLSVSLLLLVLGAIFAWKIDSVLKIPTDRLFDAQLMMGLLVASLVVRLPLVPLSAGFFITQKMVLANMIRVGSEFLRIAVLFALLFGLSTRVIWVVVAAVTADCLRGAVTQFISRRLVPELRFRIRTIRWELARELVSFGAWRFLSQLADRLRSHADVLILNQLATPVDVTSYHVGSLPRRQLGDTIAQGSMSMVPPLTALHAQQKIGALRHAYLRGGRLALWLALAVAVPAMVFCREIMHLYLDGKYPAAATVMVLLLAAFPIGYGHFMLPRMVTATASVKAFALRTIVAQSCNIGLTLYLVGALGMGAVGSALSTLVVTAFLNPILMWPLGMRLAQIRFPVWMRRTMLPGLLPGVVTLGVCLLLQRWWGAASWGDLGICVALSLITYGLVTMVVLPAEDRADLSRVIAALRSKLKIRPDRVA